MADEPIQVAPAPTPVTPPIPQDDVSGISGPLLQTLAGPEPTAQPAQPTAGRRKEVLSTVPTAEIPAAQAAEVEPLPEDSPEMEKFVEKVESNAVKPPTETVIAQEQPSPVPKTVTQPVVVLPMTQKDLSKGQSKSITYSIRWLAEWCFRQIRKFKDVLVVYRENP